MSIDGIPDGWDVVRIGRLEHKDFFIDSDGDIRQYDINECSLLNKNYPIILKIKIEQPKRYRRFANAAEAETLWDAKLQFKGHDADRFRVTAIRSTGVTIGGSTYRYEEAFERLECSDGTPFGIEVTS